ncbi:hypothetical protein DHEL01_v200559 [Diaporthe helianthi]|uniref:Spo12-like protein n=1 Tax=Diaporthe helianthi TaxID=158607 RepID=A0A2P5IEW4_DIAHE|nr:hypothetical protein DHEL01_v200559 [Diaporthe helianthi]
MSSITSNTGGANVLGAKDANLPVAAAAAADPTAKVKSMEYHRQVLQSKMEAQQSGTNYVSPSDEIMSPCTAKLNAFRNKQVGKVKPKSLFAQASSKRLLGSEGVFGPKADPQPANKA